MEVGGLARSPRGTICPSPRECDMESTSVQPGDSPSDLLAEPEELGFDEAIALYENEWVLMKVLEYDEHYRPVRGLVFAHSPSRDAISEVMQRVPKNPPGGPHQPYYTFNAFPRVRPGESFEDAAVRIAAERAAAEDVRRARRRS
jgi:hypothetical protein